MKQKNAAVAFTGLLMLYSSTALAHANAGSIDGFTSGLSHPIGGLDHVVAMIAVGLWGAFLGAPAIWILPVVFPMVMALGGVLGIAGVPVPGVEIAIAISGIVLGAMVLFEVKPPIWVAAILVGIFAIFHGYAHGAELPNAAAPLTYSLGFVIATGLLHLSGIGFGVLTRWPKGKIAVRGTGAAISLVGVLYLTGVL